MFSILRKSILLVTLALLCVYFTINFSQTLEDRSHKELTQATLRVNEYFEIITKFVSDTSDMGNYYFELENPRIDKNFDEINFSDNFYYSTDDRLMDLNRRISGRGSKETVERDSYYINVAFFLDRFFRDFSYGYDGITSINYYSNHLFIYNYSDLGKEYISKFGYYAEKDKAKALMDKIKDPDDILWGKTINTDYMNQKELIVSAPVYNDGEKEGIISVNVSVQLLEDILNNNFYQSFLIDRQGFIIASNAESTNPGKFENIKDADYFGSERGKKIVDVAFGEKEGINRNFYCFSEPILDEYVILIYVPIYTYVLKFLTNLIAIFVIGKIIFWLNDTYEKRRKVRVELKQKYKDVSKFKEELEEVATTDFLTKLYNRRYLLVRLEEEKLFHRLDENAKFVVLMMDIDHFKKVNDTYGHKAGDEVLKIVSSVIKENVRKEDLVARWGGEEIIVILVDSNLEQGQKVAEKIRQKISETVAKVDDDEIKVTISIGVESIIMNDNFDDALVHADAALYGAKSTGRNKVVLYSELDLENELSKRSSEW